MNIHSSTFSGMRNPMERIALLPFTMGCICEPAIAVVTNHQLKRSTTTGKGYCKREMEDANVKAMKNSSSLVVVRRLQKLVKNITNVSHLFVYKEEESEEEAGSVMEIGFPTDVKHVTHIGLEASGMSDRSVNVDDIDPRSFWPNITH